MMKYKSSIEETLTNTDPLLIDMIKSMVKMSPEDRITADELVENSYFDEIRNSLDI